MKIQFHLEDMESQWSLPKPWCFLALEANTYKTGESILVDGGSTRLI